MKKSSKFDASRRKDKHFACTRELVQKTREFNGASENRTHWVKFTSFWRFNYPRLPKGFEVSFIVMLKKPMHGEIIKRKLCEAFG